MLPDQLYEEAKKAISEGSNGVTLVLPQGHKRPPGFPRGELLCETDRGRVYRFKADKIIAWLVKNKLVVEA